MYKKRQGLSEFSQDEDELVELFDSFQVILSMTIISRSTDIQVKPIRMFNFDNYERIEILIMQ